MKLTALFHVFLLVFSVRTIAQTTASADSARPVRLSIIQLLTPGIHMAGKLGVELKKKDSAMAGSIRVTGHDTLQVIQQDNMLSFKGKGTLQPLDSLTIDLAHKKAQYKNILLEYKGIKEMNKGSIQFNWTGYSHVFAYEFDDASHMKDLTDYSNLTTTRIMVNIGYNYETRKPLLIFIFYQIEKGRPVRNTIVACTL